MTSFYGKSVILKWRNHGAILPSTSTRDPVCILAWKWRQTASTSVGISLNACREHNVYQSSLVQSTLNQGRNCNREPALKHHLASLDASLTGRVEQSEFVR